MGLIMKIKTLLLAGVIFTCLFLVACSDTTTPPAGTSPGAEDLKVIETSVSENAVVEPIYINNCGNPASAEQVSQHSQTITVGGSATLGFDAKVVNGSVEGNYSSTKGVTKSQKVTAAPNTNMEFILLWKEKVSEGTVTASGHSGQATYRVSVPIAVEQVSAENLGCPGATPTATSTPKTSKPVNTASPLPSDGPENAEKMDTILRASLLEGKAPLKVNFDARASFVQFLDGSVDECGNSQFCSFTFTIIPDSQPGETIHLNEGRLAYTFSRKGEYIVAVYVCRGGACDEDSVMISIR